MGENPAAVDAAGINVFGLRYLYIVVGGALAGVAGAYLSLAYAPSWLENMTAGRGWIAVALVIFALWDPWRAMAGSYLFGGIDALGFNLQVLGVPVSGFILNMLPYSFYGAGACAGVKTPRRAQRIPAGSGPFVRPRGKITVKICRFAGFYSKKVEHF